MANSTSASADTFIRTNLLSLQSSFFQSLRNGTEVALAAFHEEMTAFNEALTGCAQDLEEETRQMVYSFTQMSDAVIPELIDLDIASEKINQELNEDIDKILNELSLDDTRYLEPETLPPYIQPAYVWLLNHLHNPYPSKQTRTLLSKQTNTPEKDVDLWFTDIRKRIGWNLLRKKHFATRKDMIAAATRFFKPSPMQLDPGTEPETTITFDQEFAAMENTAKHLYSRRFSTSILANRLSAVKEVRPEPDPAGQGTSAREMSSHEVEPIPDSPYASSELVSPSPPTFSSPSSAPSPSQPSSQGRKRRQSNSDFSPSIESRPLKRNRVDISTDPSPAAREHSPSLLYFSSPSAPTNSIPISETSHKRKRQSSLSDSEDDQSQMKRVRRMSSSPLNRPMEPPAGPSNLIDLDHWLKSLCGEGVDLGHSIPEPVYETSPLAAGVEIDFYRYASSSPSTSVSSLGPSTPPDYNASDSPATSHQSLSLESPPLTKAHCYNGLAGVTSEFLSTNWSEESFLFDLNAPGILDADFPSQNWDLGLTPAMSANNYSISQVLQEVFDESTQPWTNEVPALPISIPKPSNQLSPLTSFSDNKSNKPLPQIFQHPLLDKKGAKIRYLQTLLNEVQNVRLDLAL